MGMLSLACQPGAVSPAAEKAWGGDSALGAAFDRAAAESLAPTQLLIALAYEDTRFVAPPATLSHDGASARYGVMALTDGGVRDIVRAAALAGASIDQVKTDDATNIRAAALLLGELATKQLGGLPRDIEGWRAIYKLWSGADDANVQTGYADRLEQLMVDGVRASDAAGRTLILHPVSEEDFQGFTHGPANTGIGTHVEGVDYPGALWVAANSGNYTAGGEDTRFVVIHDMEGSYSGSISWFQNSAAQASAHYCIRSSDGQITQMVREADIAWHAGNWYYNQHAIGIEHEGYESAPATWYTEAMYASSARLVASIHARHGVPIDNAHIFGHYQVPASGSGPPCSGTWAQCDTSAWGGANNHRDPGPGWNWSHYFDLVNGGGTTRPDYGASYHAETYTMDMTSGDIATVYLEYTNDGSRTWDTTNTRVGTTMPRDRMSAFYDSANWISANRPTAADHSTYNTGAVGRFTFTMKAPDVQQTTTFTEHWGLVQEGVTWFGPADGNVWFQITVHPKSTPGGGGTVGSGGSGGGVGEPGPNGTPNPSGNGMTGDMNGGCAAAPGAPAMSPLFLLALAALLRRRK